MQTCAAERHLGSISRYAGREGLAHEGHASYVPPFCLPYDPSQVATARPPLPHTGWKETDPISSWTDLARARVERAEDTNGTLDVEAYV